MPFIPPIVPGEGLAIGMGMFIFCSGEPCGFGEAAGICIPGMFICVWGDAEGDGCGICIPGIFICVCGDCDGEACGICICCAEGLGSADCPGEDDGCAGMFMFIFRAGAFLEREAARDVAGMVILFMLIPRIPPLVRVRLL